MLSSKKRVIINLNDGASQNNSTKRVRKSLLQTSPNYKIGSFPGSFNLFPKEILEIISSFGVETELLSLSKFIRKLLLDGNSFSALNRRAKKFSDASSYGLQQLIDTQAKLTEANIKARPVLSLELSNQRLNSSKAISLENFNELKRLNLYDLHIGIKTLASLPKTVETISISNGIIKGNRPSLLGAVNLKRLNLSCIFTVETFFDCLPNGLKELTIEQCIIANKNRQSSDFIKRIPLKSLPVSLTKLKIATCILLDDDFSNIGHLRMLKVLDLSGLNMTGSNFNQLPDSLEMLYLSGSNVTDDGIKEMHHLRNLTVLDLNATWIYGIFLDQLPEGIVELEFSHCHRLTDIALKKIHHLVHLKKLDLDSTSISGSYFEWLPANLTDLILSGCKNVTNASIKNLQHLKGLELLDLCRTRVTGETLDSLSTNLKDLELSLCNLTDTGVGKLSLFKGIQKELDFSYSLITGVTLNELPLSLEVLDLSLCSKLIDKGLKKLNAMSNLKKLILSHTSVTGSGFSKLPGNLEVLILSFCDSIRDASVANLYHLQRLRILNLVGTKITGSKFNRLPKNLEELDLHRCRNLAEKSLKKLQSVAHTLIKLDLGCSGIKGTEPINFSFDSLEELNLTSDNKYSRIGAIRMHYKEFGDVGVVNLLSHMKTLKTLTLSCSAVTGLSFDYLPIGLEELNCCGCNSLIDEGISRLRHLKNLNILNLNWVPLITGATFDQLKTTKLEILNLIDCKSLVKKRIMQTLPLINSLKRVDLTGNKMQFSKAEIAKSRFAIIRHDHC